MRALALVLLLAGCGAPELKLEKLPPPAGAAGEVVVVRPASFIGEELGFVVNVDQRDIHTLEAKEHIRVRLAAGEHRIAVRCYQTMTGEWKETAITHQVVAGATAYLQVAPRHSCASLELVPEAEGRRLAARTAFKPL